MRSCIIWSTQVRSCKCKQTTCRSVECSEVNLCIHKYIYGRTRVKVYIIEYNNWLYCGLVNFFEIFVSYYLSAFRMLACWSLSRTQRRSVILKTARNRLDTLKNRGNAAKIACLSPSDYCYRTIINWWSCHLVSCIPVNKCSLLLVCVSFFQFRPL